MLILKQFFKQSPFCLSRCVLGLANLAGIPVIFLSSSSHFRKGVRSGTSVLIYRKYPSRECITLQEGGKSLERIRRAASILSPYTLIEWSRWVSRSRCPSVISRVTMPDIRLF